MFLFIFGKKYGYENGFMTSDIFSPLILHLVLGLNNDFAMVSGTIVQGFRTLQGRYHNIFLIGTVNFVSRNNHSFPYERKDVCSVRLKLKWTKFCQQYPTGTSPKR